jgi:shikimate kinase
VNGSGAAWGAISIVNALPTGVGAAASISLAVHAQVSLTPSKGGASSMAISEESDTPLVRRSVLEALRRLEPEDPYDASLRLVSSIPPGRGLKSSSAVCVAIFRAIASAGQRSVSPEEAARFASEVGRSIGLSATGAFDDALASALGGWVVVDTNDQRLLRHDEADRSWKPVLWIPRGTHRPSPEWLDAFHARASEARGAVDAAKTGRYLVAMDRNTELVEKIMGYDYRPLRRELSRQGALVSGVSGMGPTLAAIATARTRSKVGRTMPIASGEVLEVEFVPPGSVPPHQGIG